MNDPVSPQDATAELLVRLARAMHAAGSPAYRLEEALTKVAAGERLEAQFFSTPTSIFAAFGSGIDQRMVLARVAPGDVDLERMHELAELLEALSEGRLDRSGAIARLDAIEARVPRYGPTLSMVAFAAVSAGAARFFGGGWIELAVAAAVGLVIGLLAAWLGPRPAGARVFELVAAGTASLLATLAAATGVGHNAFLVTLAGLIVLVPGLTLTVAMNELASRHLVAGSARLAGALTTFVVLAFGVAIGAQIGSIPGIPTPIVPVPTPAWTEPLALLCSAAGLTVLLRARPRDFPWVLAAAVLAVVGGRLGAAALGPELGAFLGALVIGLAGNAFARWTRRPAAILQVPGLLLLVPGSVGFRSLAALLERETLAGIQTAFSMVLVSIALVAGLLVAGAVLSPRRAL